MADYDYLIVGAGFAGSVLAERIVTQLGKKVLVIDKRDHVGGNCFDYFNKDGIFVQKYGPHIFHTKNREIFDYLSKFTEWKDYKHKVFAFYKGKHYIIPINLNTVNKFYGLDLKDEAELRDFLDKKKENISEIKNSRDVVVSKFGEELYEAFVKHYTKKQWDLYPEELHKSVLERLPIKYDKNDNFFMDPYQGMPKLGFSEIFKKMLFNKNLKIGLNIDFFKLRDKISYKNIIYTGPLDKFFNNKYGKLKYRRIKFTFEDHETDSFQPNSVVNHTDKDNEFSRVTEFKKFYDTPTKNTVICKELFSWEGEPSYPVFDMENIKLAEKYMEESNKHKNVFFVGRLAQYKYLNMDQVVDEALKLFEKIKANC